MMLAIFLRECPGRPTLHPRRRYGNPVNTTATNWNIPTDFLKTLLTEELTGTRHVVLIGIAKVVGIATFYKGCTRNTKFWILGELTKKELDIVAFKRNIGIQISDDVVGDSV